mmetsp:Transcript_14266/g.33773  ORF Transcript_14266/g.33773 Transcript_14266/m.33773 type:complete len:309 (+) Transcript_14266:174-1100(+)|eukprot:CAMPEP_0172649658 /NCGR_PEP_ID=MMETSP1068-20121228/241901_1 /TAXON_ID=35684 /ORGANISM="Pseudopedinella elastica, Strain CCMP716" /LENGTH=308 /DNA_ID=CAMNT_0013464017 /DNA_START=140 /DNA_END=1066 /DNA_ORIENTATION=-
MTNGSEGDKRFMSHNNGEISHSIEHGSLSLDKEDLAPGPAKTSPAFGSLRMDHFARRLSPRTIAVALFGSSFALVVLVFAPFSSLFLSMESACNWIRENMLVGALIFIPVEVLWVVSCVPTTPLEMACGYAFGMEFGFIVDTLGKLLGSVVSFALGRYFLRDCAASKCAESGSSGILRAIDQAISNEGSDWQESFQLLVLLQLAYIPVSIKNYGLSFTSVPFWRFLASALVGEAPGTLAVVWTGASTADLVGLLSGDASAAQEGDSAGRIVVAALGSGALVLGMVILGTRIQRHLNRITTSPQAYNPV